MKTTKIRDAIRDTLQRNGDMLIAEHWPRTPNTAMPVAIRAMLDACANNLAMMVVDRETTEQRLQIAVLLLTAAVADTGPEWQDSVTEFLASMEAE